jgi:membrane protein DedA with SNARE-associated domain
LPPAHSILPGCPATCARYGSLFVIVARFLDGFRQLGSLLVGSLNMPVLSFSIMTALGAALWVGVWGAGYNYLDRNAYAVVIAFRHLSPWSWGTMGIILAVLLLYLHGGRRKPH